MSLDKMVAEFERTLVVPDLHIPFHDEKSLKAVNDFIVYFKPNTIIQQGDMYDFYDVSKFDKNPERVNSLQREIDTGKKIWKEWKKRAPKAKFVFKKGNHESRLERYLMKNPELHSLKCLHLPELLGLDELGVEYVSSEKNYFINKSLLVMHGDKDDGCRLAQFGGYSAKLNVEKLGISLIGGHTHRMGAHYRTFLDGQKVGIENGCLCDLHPEYVKNPDWQQGITVVFSSDNRFYIQAIPIVNNKFIYDGKMFGGENGKNKM